MHGNYVHLCNNVLPCRMMDLLSMFILTFKQQLRYLLYKIKSLSAEFPQFQSVLPLCADMQFSEQKLHKGCAELSS